MQRIPADNITTPAAETLARSKRRQESLYQHIWKVLDSVKDPEIPVLSIWDMGILQDVLVEDEVVVVITPTYSGCPAMDVIKEDIFDALHKSGYENVQVKTRLSPAWTTEWMTLDAKKRMREFGIASPTDTAGSRTGCQLCNVHELEVICPQCRSKNTKVVSEFGSTACKALMQCRDCGEPFDYFKQI